jgi:hypothetical protein
MAKACGGIAKDPSTWFIPNTSPPQSRPADRGRHDGAEKAIQGVLLQEVYTCETEIPHKKRPSVYRPGSTGQWGRLATDLVVRFWKWGKLWIFEFKLGIAKPNEHRHQLLESVNPAPNTLHIEL